MFKLCFFLLFIWPSLTVSVYDGSATDNKERNREDLSPVNVHGYDASSTTYLPPVVIDPRRRPRERGQGRSAAGLPGMMISDGMARRNLRRNGRSSGMVIPDDFQARRVCLSVESRCRSMQCIAKCMKCIAERVGDGDNNCDDNSDEQTGECRSDQFQCRNMKCIDKNYVGDGDNDCGDNSDEQTECRSDQFQCRNMKCIDKNWVGDGDNDCGDNSDEQTDRRSVDSAVGGSSEHTSSTTGDSSSNVPLLNRPTRNRPTTENAGDNSARIRATTENITPIRRSRFGWYSAVVRRTGDAVGSAATHRLDEYIRAPVPNPSVPLSCPEPNGLFPHPHECSKYLQCDHNSLFTRTCGPGTVFNPLNSVCDWPYNVNC